MTKNDKKTIIDLILFVCYSALMIFIGKYHEMTTNLKEENNQLTTQVKQEICFRIDTLELHQDSTFNYVKMVIKTK